MLDTVREIATPEGVELSLPTAGLAARGLARLIDFAIKLVLYVVATIVAAASGAAGVGLLLVFLFLLMWFYDVAFEVYGRGATPGKRTLGLRVVNAGGTPVGWSGSLLRNLLRAVDLLPGTYAFGIASMLVTRDFQRLGDLAAGTLVVYDYPAERPAEAGMRVPARAPRVPLAPEEQEALMAFGERAPLLTEERREELAAILAGVFPGAGAEELRGYAAWYAGRGRTDTGGR